MHSLHHSQIRFSRGMPNFSCPNASPALHQLQANASNMPDESKATNCAYYRFVQTRGICPINTLAVDHRFRAHSAAMMGRMIANAVGALTSEGAAAERLDVVKTSWKLMSEELKQFEAFTCGTSSGSANVTSTHWSLVSILIPNFPKDWFLAYVVYGSTMLCCFNDLYRHIVSDAERHIRR